jgi:hypothetical protein
MKKARTLLILFLPIIILLIWTLRLRVEGTKGVEVELPVEGFDPLDRISGHYVTYRLSLGRHDPCRPSADRPLIERQEERCLCFDEGPAPQANWAGACAARPKDCRYYLKGTCLWSGFMAGVERYYIPEADSPWLQIVPPKSTVVLSLIGQGAALVKDFRPEGEDYKTWIERKKTEQKPGP